MGRLVYAAAPASGFYFGQQFVAGQFKTAVDPYLFEIFAGGADFGVAGNAVTDDVFAADRENRHRGVSYRADGFIRIYFAAAVCRIPQQKQGKTNVFAQPVNRLFQLRRRRKIPVAAFRFCQPDQVFLWFLGNFSRTAMFSASVLSGRKRANSRRTGSGAKPCFSSSRISFSNSSKQGGSVSQ